MFVDQADIEIFAGDGGNGCVSFRREKYMPHGGPDGGDGGDGGSVFIEAVHGVDTLLDMVGRHHWYAKPGEHGMGKKMAGKDGKDLVIKVPPGTLVYDRDTGLLVADLKESGKKVTICKGGKGGKGNIHYVSPVRQAPEFAQPGTKGQRRAIHLELKLIADVGLVGLPNAGKSTLLSRLSAAKPKIADYPFTTLVPQLGIAELDAERRLVIADIPGLIEGANEGAGLGLDFLRHIERTRVIVHLVDILPLDGGEPAKAYHQIRRELEAYSPKLAAKPELLVANKMDLSGASEALADLRDALPGKQILAISAVAGTGMRPLLEQIWSAVQRAPASAVIVEEAPKLLSPLMRAADMEDMTTLEEDVAAWEKQKRHGGSPKLGESRRLQLSEAKLSAMDQVKPAGRTSKYKRGRDKVKVESAPEKDEPLVDAKGKKRKGDGTRESEAARKIAARETKRELKNPHRIPDGMLTIPGKVTGGRRVVSPRTTADQRLKAKQKRMAEVQAARDAEAAEERKAAEAAALAAEIKAMKADDKRKGKFYK